MSDMNYRFVKVAKSGNEDVVRRLSYDAFSAGDSETIHTLATDAGYKPKNIMWTEFMNRENYTRQRTLAAYKCIFSGTKECDGTQMFVDFWTYNKSGKNFATGGVLRDATSDDSYVIDILGIRRFVSPPNSIQDAVALISGIAGGCSFAYYNSFFPVIAISFAGGLAASTLSYYCDAFAEVSQKFETNKRVVDRLLEEAYGYEPQISPEDFRKLLVKNRIICKLFI